MSATAFTGFDSTYEEVPITKTPNTYKWVLPRMYRMGMYGIYYAWQIGFDGKMLQTVSGTVNAPQYSDCVVELNTTGRDINEQAFLQAKGKYKNKFYEGYQLPGDSDPPMVKVMKGHIYDNPKQIQNWPVLLSWKLNGVRTLASYVEGNISLVSYLNRSFNHLIRIREQVLILMPYLPQGSVLDGEAYLHGMCFDDIISAVKTMKKEHPQQKNIIYHIFDVVIPENPPMDDRYEILKAAHAACIADGNDLPNIKICEHWKAWNHDQVIKSMDIAVNYGFEGVVIRYSKEGIDPNDKKLWVLTQYKFGKSTHIFKVKKFYDEEGIVIRVEAATGKEKNLAILILQDRFDFEVRIRGGTNDQRKKWLLNPSSIIGKLVTFKHVGRNPKSNVAIQPTIVAVRDYEIPKGFPITMNFLKDPDTISIEF